MKLFASPTAVTGLALAVLTIFPLSAVSFQNEVIRLTNVARADQGLPPLTKQSQLTAAAQKHAADMGTNGYFSHTGLDGSTPSDRATREGYPDQAGENIAAGQATPAAVVNAWMKSPGHRANILNSSYQVIGVGYHSQKSDPQNFQHYWVQLFGSDPSTGSGEPALTKVATIKVLAGQRIRTTITANVKARKFTTLGKSPTGLKLRRNSGRLVGRITKPGSYRVRIQATFDSQKLRPINVRIRVR